jgi:bacillithiol system protein YtxJ
MGFSLFNKGKEDEKKAFSWKNLNEMSAWEEVLKASESRPQIVFKHSTRCIISKTVLRNLEGAWKASAHDSELYYLDLISNRDISNRIAADTGIHHESPQLIILEKGRAVYDRSHHSIEAEDIQKFLTSLNG